MDNTLIKGFADLIILHMIKTLKQEERYGYDIQKAISRKSNGKIWLSKASVYRVLATLNAAGLTETKKMKIKQNRIRVTYKLTPEGENFYHQKTKENEMFLTALDNILK